MNAIRVGYIRSFRADLVWFLGLPYIAIAVALTSQQLLPFVALASFNLWITVPHHFATWYRTYGHSEDWQRFRVRLIAGPMVIVGFARTEHESGDADPFKWCVIAPIASQILDDCR